MREIVMAIKPVYANKIYEGVKRFEYRKRKIEAPFMAFIYETKPVQKVTGVMYVSSVIIMHKQRLLCSTFESCGISVADYFAYYKGCDLAVGFVIASKEKFKTPLSLSHFNLSRPPQSFCYVN